MKDEFADVFNKRKFLLMLHPAAGQDITSLAGMINPSEDIQDLETTEVVTNWVNLASCGILPEINNTAKWVTDFVTKVVTPLSDDDFDFILPGDDEEEDDDDEELGKDQLRKGYFAYGVALISHLLNTGLLATTSLVDVEPRDFAEILYEAGISVQVISFDELMNLKDEDDE